MPKLCRKPLRAAFFALLAFAAWTPSSAQDPLVDPLAPPTYEAAELLYQTGEYQAALDAATQGSEFDSWNTSWTKLAARSLLQLGRYEKAFELLGPAAERFTFDLRLNLLAHEAALQSGRKATADSILLQLAEQINRRSRRYQYDLESLVALGDAALLLSIEPRVVLENVYRHVQQQPEPPASVFLSTGRLALEKSDFALAARSFQSGVDLHPGNPDLWHGLAAAFREDDRSKLLEYVAKALAINPWHIDSRILLAEHLIDAEQYHAALDELDRALAVNPRHPRALALQAALHYLSNEAEDGAAARAAALDTWSDNPVVDHVIGRTLSKKYRFEQGAAAQRAALQFDRDFSPARIQLAQDLLRLGHEQEGWQLVKQVHESDPYDIAAYNLVVLRDKLDGFVTLSSENFIVRLSAKEAPVYGQRAIRVLEAAHATLTARYDVELPRKTIVEIYPDPADFETRTFGMPGNPGFLGVCFGPVFTINSPATRESNWEAVLYHEFCHTVTLRLTRNQMPRWLSEGISVYEETLANPAWGQRLSAAYRDRILGGRLLPVSEMSSAFLQASDGEDLQFAYFQSYLIVEFIFQRFGLETVKAILADLGEGRTANDSMAQHLLPLDQLDAAYLAFAKTQAASLAPDFTFQTTTDAHANILLAPPATTTYEAELDRAKSLMREKQFPQAIASLESLIERAGYLPGPQNAHLPLARAYRETGDTENERRLLEHVCNHETHQLAPVARLLDIAKEKSDTPAQLLWADAFLAINPMGETAWRARLQAAVALDDAPAAIEAGEALAAMDLPDRPALHYQLARQYRSIDPAKAKRHVLMALEEAPRFRQAHALLVALLDEAPPAPPTSIDPDILELLRQLDLNNAFQP